MFKTELSAQVAQYQRDSQNKDDLMKKISLFIYQWALKNRSLGEELAADFYLSFHTRVRCLIRNYRDFSCPFESYLRICLEWHLKKYSTRQKDRRKKEEIYWQTTGKFDALTAYEPEESYGTTETVRINLPPGADKERLKKRILKFLIYYVHYVKPEMVDTYAVFLEMDPDRLRNYLSQAEKLLEKKMTKRDELLKKYRSLFIDLQYGEMKLRMAEDKPDRERMLEQIEKLKRRMSQLKERTKVIKMTPTTRDVARISGTSPSTTGRDIKLVRQFLRGDNRMGEAYKNALPRLCLGEET